MFNTQLLPLSDALLLTLPKFSDDRGAFVKTYQNSIILENGINFQVQESYFSISKKDVIRGMHFQTPPHDHQKIVFCPSGKILDVLLDLRKSSPTYGKYFAQELSAENHLALYIPKGFAHGFKALTENAMTYYLVSSEHNSASDTGIRYDSFGMQWDNDNPIISYRDSQFDTFDNYNSPF